MNKEEFQGKGNNQSGAAGNHQATSGNQNTRPNNQSGYQKNHFGQQRQGFKTQHEQNPHREGSQPKPFQRDNNYRQNPQGQSQPYRQKIFNKVKAEETVEDIKADIIRVEKEIELELKEIKSMRLGM